jgi:hypothetical protein
MSFRIGKAADILPTRRGGTGQASSSRVGLYVPHLGYHGPQGLLIPLGLGVVVSRRRKAQ